MILKVSNIILSDSYKVTHHKQYPEGLTNLYSYWESRGGVYPAVVMFGFNYYAKRYLNTPVTMEDIDIAEKRFALHFNNPNLFNRAGWERIVKVHGGFLPIRIKAVPEGTIVPTRNVMMTVENTDPELPWVTNYAETLLSMLWYSCTVATISHNIRKLIKANLTETGGVAGLDFKLHDFGFRGVSSVESAAIGGAAHLINFKGTDTMIAFEMLNQFYGEEMAGFSIPAAEHSTITSWGETHEYEAFENMIKQFGQGYIYAVVSDSWDIYNACNNLWGGSLKAQVLAAPGILVVRPDSGIPHEVVRQVVEILGDKFGYTVNEQGYKVLNKVRVIQGDGINQDEIALILETLKIRGWSGDNLAFGMGGALLQQCNRDTQKFAFKASSVEVNGTIRDVFKAPVTDNGKRSKKGRLKLIRNDNGVLETYPIHTPGKDELVTVWEDGKLLVDPTLAEIRAKTMV